MMDQTFIDCLKQSMRQCSRNDTVTAIHDSVAEWLRNRRSNSESDQLMPVSHLADALGVARQTVQKVYLLLESEKLIYRLPKERVWYMRRPRGSNLQNIALILPVMFSDYYLPTTEYGQRHFGVYSGIADRAMELGYALVPRQLPAPGASRSEILAAVEELKQHYAGVIHLGERHYDSDLPLAELTAQDDLPQMAIDCEFVNEPWIGSVTFDPDHVAHTVTSYLRENGHRTIGIVYPHRRLTKRVPVCSYMMIEQKTVLEAFAKTPMKFDKIFEIVSGSHFFGSEFEKQVFSTIKAPDAPTAFWCRDDITAMELIRVLKKFGCAVPRDFSVVGFDDLSMPPTFEPPLTTLRNPIYELGYTAMSHLDGYIRHGLGSFERVTRLSPVLCIRKSVAAKKNSSENIQINSKEKEIKK